MFERLMERAAQVAAARAAARRERMATRLRQAEPRGVVVSEEGDAVVLAGRELHSRIAADPEFRWLVAESRDE